MSITIATWNLWWQFGDWEARQRPIAETLRRLDADIIAVQESWPDQARDLADELGHVWTWAGPEPADPARSMGNAIVSRWPIADRAIQLLDEPDGRQYRSVVHAAIDTPAGRLPVFTTHLNHLFDASVTRIAQLQAVSEFIAENDAATLPPVLCGDLNAVPDSDEIRKLTGRSAPYVPGRVWTDAWEQVGDGEGLTWSLDNEYLHDSTWPNRRLDYVLIGWPRTDRPVGNPTTAHIFGTEPIDGVTPSDHFGVAVTIHT